MKKTIKLTMFAAPCMLLLFVSILSCGQGSKTSKKETIVEEKGIVVGANQTEEYLELLRNKNVAVVGNNTSVIFKTGNGGERYTHLVDSLMSSGINISKVFAPEHGFRGDADAGEKIKDSKDSQTNISVVSLYGSNYKPSADQLDGIDIVVFDIQDVGARFYTYLSTMHYVMEACAENDIPVIVLDRPNPNGHYIDGPMVENGNESFVSLHPVPIVYGMTIGEYAKMINGEKWLKNGVQCDLTVVPLENYTHNTAYSLPLRPSPNLPNDKSINLYPSLCLFEGTDVNSGRGTEKQFQIFGSPFLPQASYDHTFVPEPNFGAKTPKHLGEECYGLDLSKTQDLDSLNFSWLLDAYNLTTNKENFFKRYKHFDRLAGSEKLREQIEQGKTLAEIKATWKSGLDEFKNVRKKYLIYE
ncbi:exo-beta-N-acetylmuramidase NamZ family protein [Kriegella aquimaris]|uniref:Uncharacterized conserved protein YbbC, DUF1343 family n=1 Tax=Kriegella aquimaris TaxID=192904 RepID=A0A1G9V2T2_9FLAO|nr:DUF1343 domain-containing protein [Kriegella aquimaris]SDM66336.1 Uncharacterized conserved protein YbbC, DUF1343 family [Kriegella aquimaris]